MKSESEAVSLSRGKWSQPGVPHKGWECIDEYDTFERLGEGEFETCGMCEIAQVRFIHVMVNDRYEGPLSCGCVCAGHMEGSLQRAEVRDVTLRSKARRRDHFPVRKAWKLSAKGTPYIKVEGFHLMVVKREGDKFGVGATPPWTSETVWGRKVYASLDEAMKGCFDAWQHLLGKSSLSPAPAP